ncbi:hypothetical protein DSO57_1026264 [Entomophthora muscae]|uniref:Uncharacterized protein n=1 Tax=Entomophthora muscae TaxID=34485 RepID=A0ACC2S421_9FUNG|nr:hypothetical protein DSO57_1026264 [Entomophthora muscae]
MVGFKHLLLIGFSCAGIVHDRLMSGDGSVQFDLVCNTTAAMCSRVKKVLFIAGECLNNNCWSSLLGQTVHNTMQLNGKYKDRMYPQALVKQLGPKEIKYGNFSLHDMVISLNAEANFHIVGQVKHTSDTISLLDTVAHEITPWAGL